MSDDNERLSDRDLDDLLRRIEDRRRERIKLGLTDYLVLEDKQIELALAELRERRAQEPAKYEGGTDSEQSPQ